MEFNAKNLTTTRRIELIRMAEGVVAKDPKNADALLNIGVLLIEETRYSDAIEYFKRARSLRKKDIKLQRSLAKCYFLVDNFEDCRKIRRKLCELHPRDPKIMREYIDVLEAAGKLDAALKFYGKLEKLVPDDPDILNSKAEFLRSQGKYGEANEILRKIQKLMPGHAASLYLYCNSRKFGAAEATEYDGYIQLALSEEPEKVEYSQLCYAGGKIWQDCGQFDRAFEYFKTANDIRKESIPDKITVPFNNARSVFTSEYLKDRKDFGVASDLPIFIVGMPRSGTTLTESLCGAHSEITAGDELIHMTSIFKGLGLESEASAQFQNNMHAYRQSDFRDMAEEYLGLVSKISKSARHITDKLPHNFMAIGLIRLLLPNAKIIHCRRHPIDNCLSLYSNSMRAFHIKYKSDLTALGLYYRQYWQLMQHWRENIPNSFHEVFYEDLVVNTEYNARQIIDYLGLEWQDSVMNRDGSQKTIRTLSAWQARQPVFTSSSGKWRKYEKHLGPLIEALGPLVEEYEAELDALQKQQT